MQSCEDTKFSSSQRHLRKCDNKSMLIDKNYERGSFGNSSTSDRACLKCDQHLSLKQSPRHSRNSSLSSATHFSQTCGKFPTLLNYVSSHATTCAVIILTLASLTSGSSIMKSECDPSDANSCRYGAVCELEEGRSRQGEPYYRCVCPQINCYEKGLFDPVCGEREGTKEQYYNVLCLMLEQCALQQDIRQDCYGKCDAESCRAITSENLHHGPCPIEDVHLCKNGALCVYHPLLKQSSCRCPSGFTGDRCESKIVPVGSHDKDGGSNCDSKRELLTIFAIVLLSLVLILIVVCICWRSRGDRKGDDTSLWDSKATERDETTPLRESRRSDYLFPENGRKDSNK